jgi:hypothetical protein
MEVMMGQAWAGVDAGKEFHWAHLLEAERSRGFWQRLFGDDPRISARAGLGKGST